jgi:hypothetical protein
VSKTASSAAADATIPAGVFRMSEGNTLQGVVSNHKSLISLNIFSRQAFRTLLDIELYLLALGQALKAVTHDSRVMHKDIFATLLEGNKTEALGVVEPLDGTCRHKKYLWIG